MKRLDWAIIGSALSAVAAGIIVGSTTGQSALAGGLIALAPVIVIAYQSTQTRLAVEVGQREVDASLQQAAASLAQAEAANRQVDVARQQVDVAELQLAALVRPVVVAGSRPNSGPVDLVRPDWTFVALHRPASDAQPDAWFVRVVLRNVGAAPAFLRGAWLTVENARGVICQGTAEESSGGVIPQGETMVLSFVVFQDRAEMRAVANALSSGSPGRGVEFTPSISHLLVQIGYADISGRRQPDSTLVLTNAGPHAWSVEAVQIQSPADVDSVTDRIFANSDTAPR
jgi:hypothetical protein